MFAEYLQATGNNGELCAALATEARGRRKREAQYWKPVGGKEGIGAPVCGKEGHLRKSGYGCIWQKKKGCGAYEKGRENAKSLPGEKGDLFLGDDPEKGGLVYTETNQTKDKATVSPHLVIAQRGGCRKHLTRPWKKRDKDALMLAT